MKIEKAIIEYQNNYIKILEDENEQLKEHLEKLEMLYQNTAAQLVAQNNNVNKLLRN